jgi:hypothetical protein
MRSQDCESSMGLPCMRSQDCESSMVVPHMRSQDCESSMGVPRMRSQDCESCMDTGMETLSCIDHTLKYLPALESHWIFGLYRCSDKLCVLRYAYCVVYSLHTLSTSVS